MGNASSGICRSLAEDIVSGKLPPGQKLEELVLAERFQVSRTPIREALRELHARGLIELQPRKGGVVRRISLADLSEMLEALAALESLCCGLSALRMSAAQKEQLALLHAQAQRCAACGDQASYLGLNQQFHRLISGAAQNQVLQTLLEGLRERLAPFGAALKAVEQRLQISLAEHQAILQAVQAGDAPAAERAMRQHTARLSAQVMAVLRQQQALSEPAPLVAGPEEETQA